MSKGSEARRLEAERWDNAMITKLQDIMRQHAYDVEVTKSASEYDKVYAIDAWARIPKANRVGGVALRVLNHNWFGRAITFRVGVWNRRVDVEENTYENELLKLLNGETRPKLYMAAWHDGGDKLEEYKIWSVDSIRESHYLKEKLIQRFLDPGNYHHRINPRDNMHYIVVSADELEECLWDAGTFGPEEGFKE